MSERMIRRAAMALTVWTLSMGTALLSGCKPAGDAPKALPPEVAASASPSASAELRRQSDEVLARYRQMIVLMDSEAAPSSSLAVSATASIVPSASWDPVTSEASRTRARSTAIGSSSSSADPLGESTR